MRYLLPIALTLIVLLVDPRAYRGYHTPKNFALLVLVAVAAASLIGIAVWRRRKISILVSATEGLLVICLGWVVLGNPSLPLHPSKLGFWILLSLTMLAMLARQISAPEHGKNQNRPLIVFLRSLWMLGLVLALIGLWQWWTTRGELMPFIKTPMVGTVGSANGYGSFLALSIAASLADMAPPRPLLLRSGAVVSVLIMLTALALNGSRGAFLGLAGAGAALLLVLLVATAKRSASAVSRKTPRLTKLLRQRGVLPGTAVLLAFAMAGLGLWLTLLNPASSAGRLMIWELSLPMITDHPFFGLGQGRYAVEYLNYQADYFAQPEHQHWAHKAANIKKAHNGYLQVFCENGLIGGLLFLSIWAWVLWRLYRQLISEKATRKAPYYGLAAVLLVVSIHALVYTPLRVAPVAAASYAAFGFLPAGPYAIRFKIKRGVWRWGLFILAFGYAGFILHKTRMQYPAYTTWQEGVVYAEDKRWDLAIPRYRSALRRLSKKGELQFHLGSALVMAGSYTQGRKFLKQSLHHFNGRNVFLSLSYANIKLGNLEAAKRNAETAQAMFPDHLAPRLLLGVTYYKQGKIKASKVALLRCIRQQTYIQSPEVSKVARDARRLWKRFYETAPPPVELTHKNTEDKR